MSLFSQHWYRVSPLRPRLRRDAVVTRQVYLGVIWHVVQDLMSGRTFRADASAYSILGLMDGKRSVDDIWHAAAQRLGDETPSQDEIIGLLAQLHQADLLVVDARPDVGEITDRRRRSDNARTLQRFKSPFAIRIPLFDPDKMLTRTLPWVAPLLSGMGGLIWTALIIAAAIRVALDWPALTTNIGDRVTAIENVALMLAVYPAIKAMHELGHAYAVKRWGGEVHEIGVLLLLFFPVPYVDASYSSAWPNKWHRALVGAMGIMVELAVASVAAFVWSTVETGLVSAIAFAVMITAGVSTLIFNGNPLLRFDGYYVLSDLVEIPNLGPRADAQVGWLAKRYLFGVRKRKPPAMSIGEGTAMTLYSLASFFYKMLIGFGIVFYIADHYFVLGTLLAALYFVQMAVLPIWKGGKFVLRSQEVASKRLRTISISAALLGGLALIFAIIPMPYSGIAQGVVWVPETARVVAESPGFIDALKVRAGDAVGRGDVIVELRNEELAAKVKILKAEVAQYQASVAAEVKNGPASVRQARLQLDDARAGLALAEDQERGLVLRGPGNGTFVPIVYDEPRDRYLKKGDTFGYVLDPGATTMVRIAVTEYEADLIRARSHGLEVRFVDQPDRPFAAKIVREVPAARDTLPSKALSTEGAGPFALDPTDSQRLRSLQHVVVFECEILDAPPLDRVGGRVFAKFDFGRAPMAEQFYRPLRQLLLRQLKL